MLDHMAMHSGFKLTWSLYDASNRDCITLHAYQKAVHKGASRIFSTCAVISCI